jgi:hypothetical protein
MQGVGSGQHCPQRGCGRPWQLQKTFRQRRGDEADRDFLIYEPVLQRLRMASSFFLRQMQASAANEIRPDFPDRGIERDGGEMTGAIGRCDAESMAMPLHEIRQTLVRDLYALRLSG